MSVYVDKARNRFGRMIMCHMIADSVEELKVFALSIGLKLEWFQANASTPHFDISLSKRKQAIAFGAIELDSEAFVEVIRRLRKLR